MFRPMSSMENVEFAWSPTTTTTPGSPTTATTTATTEADGRTVASSRSRYDAFSPSFTTTTATAAVTSLDRHNNSSSSCPAGSSGSYPDSLAKLSGNRNRQNSDQGTVGSAGAGRVSFDQQSIHPLQLDPDLATTTEEVEDEQDVEMEEREGEGVTMLTNGDDQQQQQQWATMTTTTTTPMTIANTPVSMALATTSSSVDALTTEEAGRGASLGGNQDLPPIPSAPQPRLQPQQQHVVQKKSSFAAKLRKVFNNSKALPPTPQDASTPTTNSTVIQHQQEMQTQEDIISLVSSDDLFSGSSRAATGASGATTQAKAVTLMEQQHRGSVSSASSVDTTVDLQHQLGNSAFQRRGSNQTETPSTSPESTPCGSPTDMSTLNTIMSTATDATNQQPGGSGVVVVVGPIPSCDMDPDSTQHRHPISGSESSSSSSSPSAADDVESTVSAPVVGTMPQVATPLPTNQTAADITSALQPPPLPAKAGNPTRTVKKRLSFASISSFFSPRNGGSSNNNSATAQQEARAKQQRASSVPHIENPLVTVGRQIAGFQRRHSLNDLDDNKASSKISRVGVNSWEKDPNALPTAAAGAGHESASTGAAASTSTANNRTPQSQQGVPKPAKKLSLNNVFNKGLRRKKKNAAANALKPESSIPAKPLRSALASRSKIAQPGSEAAAHQHQQAPKVHLVHRSSVVVAGRRRSASIRSQTSSYRRHRRNSLHQHQHHHHGHNSHQHTDPFARLAEANHALAALSGHGSDAQTAAAVLRLQQHLQNQEGEFSSSQEDLDYCASPSTYDSTSGELPPSLDTQGLHYHHNNQSQEGLPISPTRPTTRLDGSTIDSTALSTPSTSHTQQRNGHPTLSPSSSSCSYSSSSSSSDRVKGSSSRSTSDGVESCSSSSYSSKQEPVAPESSHSAAASAGTTSVIDPSESSVDGSLSSRRSSADRGAVFNPLLPASAARVSVNRIAMESQQQSYETLNNNNNNNNLLAGVESASTTSSSFSTEVSSTTSASTSSATSNDSSLPAKKSSVTIMNTVAEDAVSEEEAMMQAQLTYIQQKQQQYLVEQQQPYQYELHHEQMQEEHHHHHHHVHYLPQDYHSHHPLHHHHHHHHHDQAAGYDPIPSEPHHRQPYYYPHPSLFPPRPPRQLQFSTKEPLVYPTWTPEQYDRTSDAYITASRLTPAIANKIKLELNQFKSQEMLVHEESRVYTHFFI
ncbi:bud neck involved protein [Linnemannia hyalina]|uniref:Bud neck involved protein n=1 Tax=Linnemannia hyalina TaxID=64524 RepID=A0A9P7XHL0_9FUNG|nr:bud neck involved protein [Linnemannia hyalina]